MTAITTSAAVVNDDGSDAIFVNNDFAGTLRLNALTTATEINACEWAGCIEATNNIGTAHGMDANYEIDGTDDTVYNAGANPFWYGYDVDIDFEGVPRPFASSWDIGADELVHPL